MNPFVFTVFALCLSSGALASQSYANNQYASGYSQRKMSPAPHQYGSGNAGEQSYGTEMASYGGEYNQPAQSYNAPAQAYKAPSSAQVSTYDERMPASSGYAKQQSYGKQQSYAAPAPAANYGGYGKQAAKYEEQYSAPMPFAWGYDINDGYGGAQYHKETGDEYGKRTGSYGYTDAYGVYRQVDYVADEHGFRATIKTNEPGTANESPADVELHAYQPPSNYYAGNTNYASQASYGSEAGYGKASKGYSAPAASYSQQRASYGKQQSSYAAPARQSYQEPQSYSSSAMSPVYSKASSAPAVAAKKY